MKGGRRPTFELRIKTDDHDKKIHDTIHAFFIKLYFNGSRDQNKKHCYR